MWALAALAAAALLHARSVIDGRRRVRQLRAELEFLASERQAERAGRVRAEQAVRDLTVRVGQADAVDGGRDAAAPFPLRPIGVLRSVFGRRNGTPRQPLLVPAARAALSLRPGLPPELFEGLAGYSHVWVLYVFHLNTDLHRLWAPPGGGGAAAATPPAKVRVPRLDGGRLGALATRSPHRPCPLGLSVARVVAVHGGTLVLAGADVVDGTPVLDVKPYVPFADAVPGAAAPPWVAPEAGGGAEPLAVAAVRVPPAADAALRAAWEGLAARGAAGGATGLYGSYEEYRELVQQALGRDVRSVAQRVRAPARAAAGLAGTLLAAGGEEGAAAPPWRIELDGVDISYAVDEAAGGSRVVVVAGARPAAAPPPAAPLQSCARA